MPAGVAKHLFRQDRGEQRRCGWPGTGESGRPEDRDSPEGPREDHDGAFGQFLVPDRLTVHSITPELDGIWSARTSWL